MKRTPLYKTHLEHQAKMVHFAGWEMPLSYTGATDEHRTVRNTAGLFDVSHMGRIEILGEGSDAFLSKLTPAPLDHLQRGAAQYSMLLNHEGGIIDDIYIYKKQDDRYLIIVNASNHAKDLRWITQQRTAEGPAIHDISDQTALMALQGPKSWDILQQVIPPRKKEIPLRKFIEIDTSLTEGAKLLIARTGYTGERGYELVVPAENARNVWVALMQAGQPSGMKPAGLGARDTLRLEMGYPLYGNEMNEQTTPLEADLERFIDFEKTFVGKDALLNRKTQGHARRLVGFELLSKGVPREGFLVYSEQKEVGKVTSGNYAPSLRKGIGMAYVDINYSEEGSEILIDIRGKGVMAVVVKRPFYRKKR
ncbi:MAG: glycine cleavage system aminomethyltransferase GcvT [Nitrospiria bacterium]